MIEQIDYLVRLIGIGAGLMLLAQIAAGEVRGTIKLPVLGMVVGATAYLINSSPAMMADGPLDPIVDLVAILTPFWIWLFSRRLFERDPSQRITAIVVAVLVTGWVFGNFVPLTDPAGFLILHFVALGLIADLLRVGLLEREDDLVEQRRVVRLWLPVMVAAQAGGILIFELFELFAGIERQLPLVQFINAFFILLITLFAGLALMRTDPDLLVATEEDAHLEDDPAPLDLTPSETVLHEKLSNAMAEGFYREPGLTIAGLAAELDTPEHRLRALINQRLGHRNFSAFLNRYRIAEAREKLSRREDVDLPVLTIAMDLGYNSLPTFNRAFRSETGTTPSEFRRLSFNGEAGDSAGATGQN